MPALKIFFLDLSSGELNKDNYKRTDDSRVLVQE